MSDALSRICYSITATQHSAEDSDTFFIPSTEGPLNAFRHQIIIKEGTPPFPTFTRIVVVIDDTSDKNLLSILKTHFDPSKLNGLYTSESLMGKIQET